MNNEEKWNFLKDVSAHLGIIFLFWTISACIKSTYKFEYYQVFDKLALVLNTKDFDLIDSSNNDVWVGTPGDVTYNLRLNETNTVVSCRCTDGVFQPRICRKYQ